MMATTGKLFKWTIFFSILFVFFGFNFIYCVSADEGINNWDASLNKGAGIGSQNSKYEGTADSRSDILLYIGRVIGWGSFLGFMFLVRAIWGGYLWMTAGGNSEQVEDAKKTISHALIGVIIFAGLYIISYFIINRMSFITGYGG